MARSRSRNQSGSSRATPAARSRKTAAPEVEVVEESKGQGIEDGIIIITTVLLLVAVLLVDYIAATHYDTGTFF
ncbi:MAG: hypothetical protein ACI841_004092 [Planctomycetota bacterium]|jgi:hypothetical protein